MAQFYLLTVTDVRRETRDSVVVTLDPKEEHKAFFQFIQGQYLTFRATLDGEDVRRTYSICSAVQDQTLRVGIKKVQGGIFSTWANSDLKIGMTLEVMPPIGHFYVPLDSVNRKHYVAFAGGSGITPIFAIIKTTLITEPNSRFTLFYANEASSTIMFREELEDLKNVFMGRLNLVHILNREHQEVELFNGLMTTEKCDLLFKHWIDLKNVDSAFICGPQPMMMTINAALRAHGLTQQQIKIELFATPEMAKRKPKAEIEAAAKHAEACEATVIIEGRARTFTMKKKVETILEASMREGLEPPHACKSGVCSTCRAKLVEGDVDMDQNFALEDYEIARGYILTCQSYPASDRIVVNYDH
jgi:ring-1,2-phenylacetyl-CoA epoxidase subunit PaaE